MSTAIELKPGLDGGDLDAFIAYMGTPRDFGLASRGPKHIIFTEGKGHTGETIDMIRDIGGSTQELRLLAADGHVLLDLKWTTIAFLVPNRASMDAVLDHMMNSLQSGGFPDHPFDLSFRGRDGNDIFSGSLNDDRLSGSGGADVLSGRAGLDVLVGGVGDDTLDGGNGADRMTGGVGADRFVFGSASAADGDRITDFHLAEGDKIDLRLLDAIRGTTGVDAFSFIGTDSFSDHAGELRLQVNANGTVVQGDTNGDGAVDFSVVVAGALDLDVTAFLLA